MIASKPLDKSAVKGDVLGLCKFERQNDLDWMRYDNFEFYDIFNYL